MLVWLFNEVYPDEEQDDEGYEEEQDEKNGGKWGGQ